MDPEKNSDSKDSVIDHGSVIASQVELNRDGEYNPFEHRQIVHPTSTIGSFFHLLKSSLGSGLLAMPAAFKQAGLIPGCIGTVLIGFVATHCVHVLVQTSRELCKERHVPFLNYTDTCEQAFKCGPKKLRPFARHVRLFVDCAMVGFLGGTSVYVIFVATSLKDIFDHYIPESKLQIEVYCAILLVPLILLTQLRYLKFLVPFSVFANVCLLVTFGITCVYTFGESPEPTESQMVSSVKGWPLFISTAIFAMEGINVVMPIENEMAKPQHFLGCSGVLNITMVLITLLYGTVGIFGYLKYGEGVLGSVTLNLPQDEALALTAKVLVALAVFFTYSLQMYTPIDIIWNRLQSRVSLKFHNVAQISLRTLTVVLTVVLAVAIPDLQLLIGVVGAVIFSTLGLFIPIAVQTVHKWDRGLGPFKYILVKNIVFLVFYFVALLSGCYASISEIVLKYS